ncbi:hypothetical protein CMUS01_03321 [Colletotrichum musicola]|uniref:Uncharacterized protein n=1 Tax=Colletotrichum musicola TaxID=2175873 RepID=A0A8H6NTB6_9PEZI|nr:hypothetical protein CMUS01_03321 [Colletotrichum musicola]
MLNRQRRRRYSTTFRPCFVARCKTSLSPSVARSQSVRIRTRISSLCLWTVDSTLSWATALLDQDTASRFRGPVVSSPIRALENQPPSLANPGTPAPGLVHSSHSGAGVVFFPTPRRGRAWANIDTTDHTTTARLPPHDPAGAYSLRRPPAQLSRILKEPELFSPFFQLLHHAMVLADAGFSHRSARHSRQTRNHAPLLHSSNGCRRRRRQPTAAKTRKKKHHQPFAHTPLAWPRP